MRKISVFLKFAFASTVTAASIFMISACNKSTSPMENAKSAMAMMARPVDTGSVNARGMVTFTKVSGGVQVVGSFQGLPPGVHGFHVHAGMVCTDSSTAQTSPASGALGHFNPLAATAHGLPDSTVHHLGDMGNLTAGADSIAKLDKVFSYLTLDSTNTISGHAVIIHALPDMGTQPTGGAGGRISCGVISAAK